MATRILIVEIDLDYVDSWMERLDEAIMATEDENVSDRKKSCYITESHW